MKKIWIKDIQKNYKKLILTLLIGIYYSYKYNRSKKGDYIIYKMNNKYEKYVSPKFKDLLTIKKLEIQ